MPESNLVPTEEWNTKTEEQYHQELEQQAHDAIEHITPATINKIEEGLLSRVTPEGLRKYQEEKGILQPRAFDLAKDHKLLHPKSTRSKTMKKVARKYWDSLTPYQKRKRLKAMAEGKNKAK